LIPKSKKKKIKKKKKKKKEKKKKKKKRKKKQKKKKKKNGFASTNRGGAELGRGRTFWGGANASYFFRLPNEANSGDGTGRDVFSWRGVTKSTAVWRWQGG